MTVGDRVTTRHGAGVVTEIHTDDHWTFRRPNPAVYVIVHVDGEPYARILLPEQVQPINEGEQLTMSDIETETTTVEEPATDDTETSDDEQADEPAEDEQTDDDTDAE